MSAMDAYLKTGLLLASTALLAGCAGPERDSSRETVIVESPCGFWSWSGCWWWGRQERVETRTQESRSPSNAQPAGPAVQSRVSVTPPAASPAPLVSPAPATSADPPIGVPLRR